MNDPIRFVLKDEDTAPAPLHAVPDIQALHVELSDLLARAGKATADMLDALNHARDLIDGHRLARIWGVEARDLIEQAIETREMLARGQRSAGLLSDRYGAGVR